MSYLYLKNWVSRIRGWAARIAIWLIDPWRAWSALALVLLMPLVCSTMFSGWEQRLRISGMLLELLGLSTVAMGLHQTRKLFQRPSLGPLFVDWIRRFPRFRVDTRINVPTAATTVTAHAPTIHELTFTNSSASINERVSALEKALKEVNNQIQQVQRDIQDEGRNRQSEHSAEQQQREAKERKLRTLIEESSAGGLYIETIGVLWLLVGVVLATSSNELVALFRLN